MANVISNGQRISRLPQRKSHSESQFHDIYSVLLGRLQAAGFGPHRERQTVGLTSGRKSEGVTTVASNLAIFAADQADMSVLLIDAHISSPALHLLFDIEPTPGLADAVDGETGLREFIQESTVPNLSIVTAGYTGPTDVRLSRQAVRDMLGSIEPCFDLVILDLPPLDAGANVTPLLAAIDGTLLVVESETITTETAKRSVAKLSAAGANPLGVVLNKSRSHLPAWIDRQLGG